MLLCCIATFVKEGGALVCCATTGKRQNGEAERGNGEPAYKPTSSVVKIKMVPLAGIEPALLAELDFESSASTNSATGARRLGPKTWGPAAGL